MNPVQEWVALFNSWPFTEEEYSRASATAGTYLSAQCRPIDLSVLAQKEER